MAEEFSDQQLAAEIELLVSLMVAVSHSDRHLTDAEIDHLLRDPGSGAGEVAAPLGA
jgi:hypothetical protein